MDHELEQIKLPTRQQIRNSISLANATDQNSKGTELISSPKSNNVIIIMNTKMDGNPSGTPSYGIKSFLNRSIKSQQNTR